MVDKRTLIEEKVHQPCFLRDAAVARPLGSISPMCAARSSLEPLVRILRRLRGWRTPYVKLISQLFGDRLQIANATGCSSIYGGNLPAHPWKIGASGRGPTWSNSLFEDNAEFGLGYRLAIDQQTAMARQLLAKLAPQVGEDLTKAILDARQVTESEFVAQRVRVMALAAKLEGRTDDDAVNLLTLADFLVRRSVWIVGGDGWAYDIGYGGLDHVLAQDRNVNVLVLDTEVYSNTGGQASKATPLGASAKFAAAGKRVPRKDLAAGDRLRLRLCGADRHGRQRRTDAHSAARGGSLPGPSLVLAYSHCRAWLRSSPGHEAAGARHSVEATGRSSATTRRCAIAALTRSGSTARGRG
jgi:pyruvate-ferredoxin/flavodoxin oxidoreductase